MTFVETIKGNILMLLSCLIGTACTFSQTTEPAPYGAIPTQRQLRWQETEMYTIMHYGLATYANKEWGYGNEDPATFTAPHFDAGDVIRTIKYSGFNGIVVVAKHHDGFCLWPTATTGYNITQSPWKDGKGDMIKEYQEACEKENFKMGIYCSPWDRNNPLYGHPEYVTDVYIPQLKELYANYGNLFMSWHDGANGGNGYYGGANELREIDRTTYYGWEDIWKITRAMQPGACLFGDAGPDVRWIGNEEGFAAPTSWATYTPEPREPGTKPANGATIYEKGAEGTRNGQYWMPAECDVPLRPGWFYHKAEDHLVKTPYQLLELYYKSVGRGACLDLGINLDRQGRFPEEDKQTLLAFGQLLKDIFSTNLIEGAKFSPPNVRDNNDTLFGTQHLVDGDRYSYWATDDRITTPELLIELPEQRTFNVIRLRENIKLGQRIEEYAIDIMRDNRWIEVATGSSIGANRLIRLPQPVSANKLRLRILQSPVCIALSDIGLFSEPERLYPPVITRNRRGDVSMQVGNDPDAFIYYTLDGSLPTNRSKVYQKPFPFKNPGIVRAIHMNQAGGYSEVYTKEFDRSKDGWRAYTASGNHANWAIDEDESSFWQAASVGLPQELTIDMGKMYQVNGITYLPRQDGGREGIITHYRFAVSTDNHTWQPVATGEFSNIVANPLEQRLWLEKPVSARYLKLEALQAIPGQGITVAEIGIF